MPVSDKVRAAVGWLRKRVEIAVPVLALPVFFSMAGSGSQEIPAGVAILVWVLAAVYVGLVIWSPMALPFKELRAMSWRRIGWAARIVVPLMLVATVAPVSISLFGQILTFGWMIAPSPIVVLSPTTAPSCVWRPMSPLASRPPRP